MVWERKMTEGSAWRQSWYLTPLRRPSEASASERSLQLIAEQALEGKEPCLLELVFDPVLELAIGFLDGEPLRSVGVVRLWLKRVVRVDRKDPNGVAAMLHGLHVQLQVREMR